MIKKLFFGIIAILFLVLWTWEPDFTLTEQECKSNQAAVKRLCNGREAK